MLGSADQRGAGGGSPPPGHAASRYLELLEDSRALLESGDGYLPTRRALGHLADARALWAGVPMPVDGLELVVEPSYPHAKALEDISRGEAPDDPTVIRNVFYSRRRRCTVYVYQEAPGAPVRHALLPGFHGIRYAINTLMASEAWGIEQETRAIELLSGITAPRQLKQYLLTGTFLERSPRSGVTYMFRRLRPTVALRDNRILCALCMHPIALYQESWGGAMAPTDDVVAHLVLMRADERVFWGRCTQHPPWLPNAGL